MDNIRIVDNSEEFRKKAENKLDIALGMMAQDIEMIAAFKVPVDTGSLARFIKKYRVNKMRWKVTVNKDYAAYQERGARADGSRRVKKYSRAGSGPHFMRDAINVVVGRKYLYIKKAINSSFTNPTSGTDFG